MSLACCTDTSPCGSDCLQLTEREATICELICTSGEPIGFSALKKNAGFHQEVVSRILKRLLNHRAIEKVGGKYKRKAGQ
jgi:DNA-binding IclR family transcriptional regulator